MLASIPVSTSTNCGILYFELSIWMYIGGAQNLIGVLFNQSTTLNFACIAFWVCLAANYRCFPFSSLQKASPRLNPWTRSYIYRAYAALIVALAVPILGPGLAIVKLFSVVIGGCCIACRQFGAGKPHFDVRVWLYNKTLRSYTIKKGFGSGKKRFRVYFG